MVLSRSIFKYRGQILIEKITIRPPFRYEAIFQNSGCFIYFKERGPKLFSSEDHVQIGGQEAVLLKCGSHFLDLLRETDNEQVEVVVVHLFPDMLRGLYIRELPGVIEKQSKRKQSQVVASSDVIAKFIDSLEFYFQNPSLVNNDLLELKIKELILLLIQSKNVNSILELVADLYSTKTVHLKEVIELHLYSNLNLGQLAKLCNLSLSSFKRKFRMEFGDSPTNYIIGRRLQKASELLSLTDLPIGEIAFEVGFQDPMYFTRIFKKNMKMTPSKYRMENSI